MIRRMALASLLVFAVAAWIWKRDPHEYSRATDRTGQPAAAVPTPIGDVPVSSLKDFIHIDRSGSSRILIEDEGGSPIEGAEVLCYALARADVKTVFHTDSLGVTTSTELRAGVFNLVVSAEGFAAAHHRSVFPGSTRIVLRRGCQVSVQLVGFEEGRWEGMSLVVQGAGGHRRLRPCLSPRIVLGNFLPGLLTWAVAISPAKYVPLRSLLIPRRESLLVPIDAPRVGGIWVRIRDAIDGAAIDDCQFAVAKMGLGPEARAVAAQATEVDSDGYREIRAVFDEQLQLRVEAAHYAVAFVAIGPARAGERRRVDIQLFRGAEVHVTSNETEFAELRAYVLSEPARAAKVYPFAMFASVTPPGQWASWPQNGYVFSDARRVSANSVSQQADKWVVSDLPPNADVALMAVGTGGEQSLTLLRTGIAGSTARWSVSWKDIGRMVVRVVDSATGAAIEDAIVTIHEDGGVSGISRSDREGRSRFVGFQGGRTYEISIRSGFHSLKRAVSADEIFLSGEIVLSLEPDESRESLEVWVVDESGRAIPDAVVQWVSTTASPKFVMTDSNGYASGTCNRNSRVGLWISKPGYRIVVVEQDREVQRRVVLTAAAELELEIIGGPGTLHVDARLTRVVARGVNQDAASASGLLSGAAGAPDTDYSIAATLVDGQGTVVFGDLVSGEWLVEVVAASERANGRVLCRAQAVVSPGNRTRLRIELP